MPYGRKYDMLRVGCYIGSKKQHIIVVFQCLDASSCLTYRDSLRWLQAR